MPKTAQEKRVQYMAKLEADLKLYNARLEELIAKSSVIKADLKVEYLSQVADIEKKRDDFVKKHGHLKVASEHAWDDVKTGTEKAWNELDAAVKMAVSRFK